MNGNTGGGVDYSRVVDMGSQTGGQSQGGYGGGGYGGGMFGGGQYGYGGGGQDIYGGNMTYGGGSIGNTGSSLSAASRSLGALGSLQSSTGGYGAQLSQAAQSLNAASQLSYSLYNLFRGAPSQKDTTDFQSWYDAMPDRMAMVERLMPMPYMEGTRIPEFPNKVVGRGGLTFGTYEPSEVTRGVYKGFLGGEYGMSPEELAQRKQLALSAVAPTEQNIGRTPAAAMGGGDNAMAMAKTLAQMRGVSQQDRQEYLKSAAMVAAYNASKAKTLASIIG